MSKVEVGKYYITIFKKDTCLVYKTPMMNNIAKCLKNTDGSCWFMSIYDANFIEITDFKMKEDLIMGNEI